MKGEKISILMPTRNAERYLEFCLQSIISQTETHWELIAVDDHSTDSSLEILKNFAAKDQRIRVLRNDLQGIIPALRMAFHASSGSLISRMDADDEMLPEKLSLLKSSLVSQGKGHLAVGQVEYFSNGVLGDGYLKYEKWLNRLISTGQNWKEIYKECVIPSPNWMVWREDLLFTGAFNSDKYPEDYDLCFRFRKAGLSPIPCEVITHRWRDHSERSSRNDPHYSDNRFLDLKIQYFLELDHNDTSLLGLWGAGKKGKKIARQLIEKNVEFVWFCNQQSKIGHNIYGKILQSAVDVQKRECEQMIVAVANPVDQREIIKDLSRSKYELGSSAWFFC